MGMEAAILFLFSIPIRMHAALHWYSEQELLTKIEANCPSGTWFRLALLEAMLFDPYYPLTIETDKKAMRHQAGSILRFIILSADLVRETQITILMRSSLKLIMPRDILNA